MANFIYYPLKIKVKEKVILNLKVKGFKMMSEYSEKGNLIESGNVPAEFTSTFFPTDYTSREKRESRKEQVIFTASKELCITLNSGSYESIHCILSAALILLLYKYTGERDIVLGASRFNNELALVSRINETSTLKTLLTDVNKIYYEALENQKDQSTKQHGSLYDTMIVLEGFQGQMSSAACDADMLFTFTKKDQILEGTIQYNANLYKCDTILRISTHLLKALEAILCSPDTAILDTDILTFKEKQQLLYEFNDHTAIYSQEATFQDLFEQQVKRTPLNTAVAQGNLTMTYQALNQRANRLARTLRLMGVKRESIVGIMADKSMETIVGIMGILKAGGAFVPIDPGYPGERIHYMLEDSGAELLLTTEKVNVISDYNGRIVRLDDEYLYNNDSSNLVSMSTAQDMAYVIYTSGTTGRPKGVMVKHCGISNLKTIFENDLGIYEKDKIIQFASFSFDASVWEMSMALLNGAELHLLSNEIIGSYSDFTEYISHNQITVMTLPPTYLIQLDSNQINTLRLLVTAGSSISRALLEQWAPKVKYINAYGPTESTICSTMWACNIPEAEMAIEFPVVPIGKPIANLKAYIVNGYNQLVPIGVAGELCVSGISLARGYLNKAELTDEKFVENIFEPGATMYRTGDLVRWLPDGNIEFIGRIDSQVKIRGYRIETAEIEYQLLKQEGIKEAVVVDRTDKWEEKYLCAYVTADTEVKLAQVRDELAKVLPSYM
ncbi:tyrocidine synthetase II, partial [Paenibacillus sp. FSL R7-269]|uniref:non-ribosomal peptide synthetase n=1 Tax=Paenibacillus sp. FSL R7-269 TaxID=1226755 RepID=UPI0003E26093